MIDQDEAARSAGEGRKKQREQEKLGLRGGRKAGPLKGNSGYWRGCGGVTASTGGAAEAAEVKVRVRYIEVVEAEHIANCLEEVVGEGKGAGRCKVVVAVGGMWTARELPNRRRLASGATGGLGLGLRNHIVRFRVGPSRVG